MYFRNLAVWDFWKRTSDMELRPKGLPAGSLGSRLVLFVNLRNEEEFDACSFKLFYFVQ